MISYALLYHLTSAPDSVCSDYVKYIWKTIYVVRIPVALHTEPWEDAGRQHWHQRHDVREGQQERLRPVGGAGQPRLGLSGRAALLHPVRGQPRPVPPPQS